MGRWNVYGEYSAGDFMRLLIRDIRGDEKGVASTVGTIMALLVFLTFLSLIVNQYVPVWMKDSEASHMNGALGQFGGLKGAIDLQILAAQAAKISGTHYIPVTSSSAVSLGVDGVPIFAASTLGTLSRTRTRARSPCSSPTFPTKLCRRRSRRSKNNRTGPSNLMSRTGTMSRRRSRTKTARSSGTNRTARSSGPSPRSPS